MILRMRNDFINLGKRVVDIFFKLLSSIDKLKMFYWTERNKYVENLFYL